MSVPSSDLETTLRAKVDARSLPDDFDTTHRGARLQTQTALIVQQIYLSVPNIRCNTSQDML